MAKRCPHCSKRILSHSRVLKCMICCNEFHIACCNYDRNEFIDRKDWFCISCVQDCLPFCNILEDDEYKSAIYSLYSDKPINVSILDQLVYNPFEWNQENSTPLFDIDPDSQYFSNSCFSNNQPCDYHTEETFNKYVEKNKLQNNHGISLFAHNIRSLPKHDHEMKILFSNLNVKFDIIGICETWITEENKDLYGYDGYHSPVQSVRKGRRGGGVALYIKNNLEFIERPDC